MSKVSIYLNFTKETEEAFTFYAKVFQTELQHGIMRYGDVPTQAGESELPEEVKKLVMHIELPILGGFSLMGSDAPEAMGFKVNKGNNTHIMLQPDTRDETKRIFDALAQDGIVETQLQEMFWGDYYGSLKDKFGVHWMFNCSEK